MFLLLEKLKGAKYRQATKLNYLTIWRNFNDFVIRLDKKPTAWEDRTSLFLVYLIDKGAKSATIKSYKSAIKSVLIDDGYCWDDNKILLNSLTKACKIKNDLVYTRLPIERKLLNLILFEIQRIHTKQPYLELLYKSLFAISYFGLLRIGEVTKGSHVIKAKDVHIGVNKNKILLVLYSSKTHGKESRPQKVKIEAVEDNQKITFFCPFQLLRSYMRIRGTFKEDSDQLFVFHDNSPVLPKHARCLLKSCLKNLGLNEKLYNFHSLRIGMVTSLIRNNQNFEDVKRAGRWRSNAVYKYLKL